MSTSATSFHGSSPAGDVLSEWRAERVGPRRPIGPDLVYAVVNRIQRLIQTTPELLTSRDPSDPQTSAARFVLTEMFEDLKHGSFDSDVLLVRGILFDCLGSIRAQGQIQPSDSLRCLPAFSQGKVDASLVQRALEYFRSLEVSEDERAHNVAAWISKQNMPVSTLPLTDEEWESVAPSITRLELDGPGTRVIPAQCRNLETLTLIPRNDGPLPTMPEQLPSLRIRAGFVQILEGALPQFLQELSIDGGFELRAIRFQLPDELRSLDCANCSNLYELAALNRGLRTFDCSDCPRLEALPELPEGLEVLHCRDCSFEALPALPESLKELDCRGCINLRQIPASTRQLRVLSTRSR